MNRTPTPKRTLALLVAALHVATGPMAYAAPTDLSNTPLANVSGTSAVRPNLMFLLDDSGSMMQQYTPDYVSERWGAQATSDMHCRNSADTSVRVTPGRVNTDANTNRDLCVLGDPPYMSADFNKQYYNPAIVYTPPVNYLGTSYASMDSATTSGWTSVRTDGFNEQNLNQLEGSASNVDLTTGVPTRVWCNSALGTSCVDNTGDYIYPEALAAPTATTSMPARTTTATPSFPPTISTSPPRNIATASTSPPASTSARAPRRPWAGSLRKSGGATTSPMPTGSMTAPPTCSAASRPPANARRRRPAASSSRASPAMRRARPPMARSGSAIPAPATRSRSPTSRSAAWSSPTAPSAPRAAPRPRSIAPPSPPRWRPRSTPAFPRRITRACAGAACAGDINVGIALAGDTLAVYAVVPAASYPPMTVNAPGTHLARPYGVITVVQNLQQQDDHQRPRQWRRDPERRRRRFRLQQCHQPGASRPRLIRDRINAYVNVTPWEYTAATNVAGTLCHAPNKICVYPPNIPNPPGAAANGYAITHRLRQRHDSARPSSPAASRASSRPASPPSAR